MSRILKAIQNLGNAFGPYVQGSVDDWIHSTVTTMDRTSARWTNPKASEYAAKLRQWPMIFADKNASMLSGTKMRLYREDGGKSKGSQRRNLKRMRGKSFTGSESEIENATALDILDMPNEYESGQQFTYLKHFSKQGAGNYYRMWDGDIFFTMRPQFVRIVVADDEPMIRGYAYSRERVRDVVFEATEVDHFLHRPSLDSPFYGMAPMQACIEYQDMMLNATFAEGQRWKNGGRPPYAIKLPDGLTPVAVQQAKETIRRDITGVFNSGKPLIAQMADIVNFGFPPNEMEYLEGQQTALHVIANAYGIPESLISPNSGSLSVAKEAMRMWVDGTIVPLLIQDAADETRAFRRRGLIGENEFFAYDPPTDEDRADLVEVLQRECDSGFTTYDEARAELGRDPLPNGLGAIPRFRGNVLSDKPTQPMAIGGSDPNADPSKSDNGKQSSTSGKNGDTSRAKAIANKVPSTAEMDAKLEEDRRKQREKIEALLLLLLSMLAKGEPVSDVYRAELTAAIEAGNRIAYRVGVDEVLRSQGVNIGQMVKPGTDFASDAAASADSIIKTTIEQFTRARGANPNLSAEEVGKLLAEGVKDRAILIVDTETWNAGSEGAVDAAGVLSKITGVVLGKRLHVEVIGKYPCPTCTMVFNTKAEIPLNHDHSNAGSELGRIIPLDESFDVSGLYMQPTFHPLCRCWMEFLPLETT